MVGYFVKIMGNSLTRELLRHLRQETPWIKKNKMKAKILKFTLIKFYENTKENKPKT